MRGNMIEFDATVELIKERNITRFYSLDEIQPYFNELTNAYEFFEDNTLMDIEINFNLYTDADIVAGNIHGHWVLKARDINARLISINEVIARDVDVWHIYTRKIFAREICAIEINASETTVSKIKARKINIVYLKQYAINGTGYSSNYEVFK